MYQAIKLPQLISYFSGFLKNNYVVAIISIIIGVIVFGHYFDFTVVEPNNTAWIMRLQGDQSQHYLGSVAFRSDEWHFPFTKTTLINYPEGVSIIYTDSNPLLACIAKIFKSVFLPTYQYTGIWYLICFILQSFTGFILLKKITGNNLFALLSGALFCLLPPIIHRYGHENLMAFWILLISLYVFIHTDLSIQRKSFLFFTVITLSALIHAYLTIMILIISGTWYVQQLIILLQEKNKSGLLKFLFTNAAYGSAFIILLWSVGYFYNAPKNMGLLGFGFFSMDLTAPLNPIYDKYSSFINETTVGNGQYEGFQYLGFGIILLLLFVVLTYLNKYLSTLKGVYGFFVLSVFIAILLLKNNEASFYDRSLFALFFAIYSIIPFVLYKEKHYIYFILFIPATICYALALSNIVTLGSTVIFEYPLNEYDESLSYAFFRNIRSSGRLFWATTHILIISALYLLFKITSLRKSIIILSIIVLIQTMDLLKLSYVVDSKNKIYSSPLSELNQKTILASNNIISLGEINSAVVDFAILNQKHINHFYTAHDAGALTKPKLKQQFTDWQENNIKSSDLYLFKLYVLQIDKKVYAEPFDATFLKSSALENGKVQITKNEIVKKRYDSCRAISDLIKNEELVIISSKDKVDAKIDNALIATFNKQLNMHFSDSESRKSYVAVFHHGMLIDETNGVNGSANYTSVIDRFDLVAKSGDPAPEKIAHIKINDFDYSINETGFNIVSVSRRADNSIIIHTGSIDIFEKTH